MDKPKLWHLIEQYGDVRELIAYDWRDGTDPTRHQTRLRAISAELQHELGELMRETEYIKRAMFFVRVAQKVDPRAISLLEELEELGYQPTEPER